MKKEKYKIKLMLPKKRRKWAINPRERIHSWRGYRRSKVKKEQKYEEDYEN